LISAAKPKKPNRENYPRKETTKPEFIPLFANKIIIKKKEREKEKRQDTDN
jgi:hypothetical protein